MPALNSIDRGAQAPLHRADEMASECLCKAIKVALITAAIFASSFAFVLLSPELALFVPLVVVGTVPIVFISSRRRIWIPPSVTYLPPLGYHHDVRPFGSQRAFVAHPRRHVVVGGGHFQR